jgi:hypothetical protein
VENEEPAIFEKHFTAVSSNDLRGAFGHLRKYVEGKVVFDMRVEGLGPMHINVKLPISKEALGALTVQQVENKLISWLDRAIQEESLKEWIENQSPR